jgi:polyisoprenoid-binding protein YceI
MKSIILNTRNLVLGSAMLLAATLSAQTLTKFEGQPEGCKVRMEGTSTIHDWHAESMIISGTAELDSSFPLDPAVKPTVGKVNAKVAVTIPVRSLKSSSGKPMDIIMYDHIKQKDFPKIEYKLTELMLKDIPARGGLSFEAKGELTVAGKTNPITMTIGMDRQAKDKFKFYTPAPLTLKMTDFGVQPPNPNIAGVGIKTGDEIKITIEWPLALPAK